jgi:transcriptional regulator of heat shock response
MTLLCTKLAHSLLAAALTLSSASAFAQYQWKDENGRMVYSDKAPPNHIKPENVIRAEPKRPVVVTATSNGQSPAAASKPNSDRGASDRANSDKAPLSAADRELEARRKEQEQNGAEKKRKEQAEAQEKLAKACDELRGELRNLESGMRVARVNTQGEREFLSDEEREQRLGSIKRDMKDSCKAG